MIRTALFLTFCAAIAVLSAPFAHAAQQSVQGVNFESPDDPAWVAARVTNGLLYQWSFTNPENGRRAGAIITIGGTPGYRGDAVAAVPEIMDSAGLLAGARPTQEHAGATTAGDPMAWAMRAGSTGDTVNVEVVVTGVAVRPAEGLASALLILVNVDSASRDAAERAFDGMVGSIHMGVSPPPPLPPVQAGSESLSGLYIYTDTNFVMSPMGGSTMTTAWKLRDFDPGGLYASRPPLGEETLASLCGAMPDLCGTYRIDGATVTTTELARFGLVETRTGTFERKGDGFTLGRYPYYPAKAIATATLNGSWRFNYYSGGPRGSVMVIRQIDFTADGRYVKTGFNGVTNNDAINGTTTTTAGTDPEQTGRYEIDGFTLKLMNDAGKTELMSLVVTDPADLSFVFIDGDSYAQVEK